MCHELIQSRLVRKEIASSPGRLERYSGRVHDEVRLRDHAGVEGREHRRIADDRTELLHQVERERGATEARLMVEAEQRVEPRVRRDVGEVFGEHRVGERKQRVDGSFGGRRFRPSRSKAAAAAPLSIPANAPK